MRCKSRMTCQAWPRRNVLVMAMVVGLGTSSLALGQATSGSLFGTAPAGDTVQVQGSGLTRTAVVGADGQWVVPTLPLGRYTVSLIANGKTIATQTNVIVHIGAGVAVTLNPNAAPEAQQMTAVQVNANALPTIDVTTIHDSTIITAQQLRALPLGHNAFSIALLTPGTLASTAFANTLTFGGSSGAENAYYVNGYNTAAPYRNMSMFALPYGAIGQQQTLAGGFGAKYGRSDGGVISQTGQRGTNEWHFGGQILWAPRSIAATPADVYRPVQTPPTTVFQGPDGPVQITNDSTYIVYDANGNLIHAPGSLYRENSRNGSWDTTYTAYVGGPIIKDELFFFVDVAVNESKGSGYGTVDSQSFTQSSSHDTKTYGKLDWNINDNNIFEFTYLGEQGKSGMGRSWIVDPDTGARTLAFINDQDVNNSQYFIAHYTSYISDNATLSLLYGHGRYRNPIIYGVSPALPVVVGQQNCAYVPDEFQAQCAAGIAIPFPPKQTNASVTSPLRQTSSHGLRVDFTYQLGSHKLGVGVDNMYYYANAQGTHFTGPAAPAQVVPFNNADLSSSAWAYSAVRGGAARVLCAWAAAQTQDGQPVSSTACANGQFYFVTYVNQSDLAGMRTTQKAFYLQDDWQITPNLLAVIGVRDDEYVNYNNLGGAFVTMKNQWSPRVGMSWDVFGDSSLKIYGNLGRYYLALPLEAATDAADSTLAIDQHFTYTGIDPDSGIPGGLRVIDGTPFGPLNTPHVFSSDGAYGGFKDPKQVTASNLRPEYVDQINLGFDAKLGEHWQYGASLHYRKTGVVIDDECEPDAIAAKMVKMGLDPGEYLNSLYYGPAYCRLINPGQTDDIELKKDDGSPGYTTVPVTFKDWGYPEKPKRTYAALDVYLQRNFDGKWAGRIDYTNAAGYGNTAGQLRPDFLQNDVSKTEDWDYPAVMEGAYGQLYNARRHVIRLRGTYQVTPEWRVGLVGTIASGTPQECLGFYGPNADGDPPPSYGGGSYHWCAGRIVSPGSSDPLAGHTPWTHQYNLDVTYVPAFAGHRLSVQMIVYNALNEQKTTQTNPVFAASSNVPYQMSSFFHYAGAMLEPPRSIDLVLSYDY